MCSCFLANEIKIIEIKVLVACEKEKDRKYLASKKKIEILKIPGT